MQRPACKDSPLSLLSKLHTRLLRQFTLHFRVIYRSIAVQLSEQLLRERVLALPQLAGVEAMEDTRCV